MSTSFANTLLADTATGTTTVPLRAPAGVQKSKMLVKFIVIKPNLRIKRRNHSLLIKSHSRKHIPCLFRRNQLKKLHINLTNTIPWLKIQRGRPRDHQIFNCAKFLALLPYIMKNVLKFLIIYQILGCYQV